MRNVHIKNAKTILEDYISLNANRTTINRNVSRDKMFNDLKSKIEQIERDKEIDTSEALREISLLIEQAHNFNQTLDDKHEGKSTDALINAQQEITTGLRKEKQRKIDEAHKRQLAEENKKNPNTVILEAIKNNKLGELNPAETVERLVQFNQQKINNGQLSDSQELFQKQLKQEFENRQLNVGEGLLTLLVHSPLAKRFETLHSAYNNVPSRKNSLEQRKMIQTVGEIVRILTKNTNGSLKDTHNLFILKDEKSLLELLHLLQGKKMIEIAQNNANNHQNKTEKSIYLGLHDTKKEIQSTLSDDDLDMEKVERVISALGTATKYKEDQTTDAKTLDADIKKATEKLYSLVNLSSSVSRVIEEICVTSSSMIHQLDLKNVRHDHQFLQNTAETLKPQFAFLMALNEKIKIMDAEILTVFNELKSLYEKQGPNKLTSAQHQLLEEAKTISQGYQEWQTKFKNTHEELGKILQALNSELSTNPAAGHDAANHLLNVSHKAQQEDQLKDTVRTKIIALQKMLQSHKLHQSHLASQASMDSLVSNNTENSGYLSIELLAKLANKFSQSNEDCEPSIDLVKRLQKSGVLTTQIEHKLLHQNDHQKLLNLQKFLDDAQIKVTPSLLSQLWDSLKGSPSFTVLKSLHDRLNLSSESTIACIENLSQSWNRSLAMLNIMFEDVDNYSPQTFDIIVARARTNPGMTENIFQIFDAIMKNQPEMKSDFFQPQNMEKLIDAISHSEMRFTDEIVYRLNASSEAPFKPEENWVYLMQRTIQYNARNLSYTDILPIWHEKNQQPYFDDYSNMLLGKHAQAQYDGAHQTNTSATLDDDDQDLPQIDDTSAAQWHLAVAHNNPQPIQYDALESEINQHLSSQVNLGQDKMLLLNLMQIALRKDGVIYLDNNENTSFVGWLPNNDTNQDQAQFMEHYLYLTISSLSQQINELKQLSQEAKKLSDELFSEGLLKKNTSLKINFPQSLSELQTVISRSEIASNSKPGLSGEAKLKVARLVELVDQISQIKEKLSATAKTEVQNAFDITPQMDSKEVKEINTPLEAVSPRFFAPANNNNILETGHKTATEAMKL